MKNINKCLKNKAKISNIFAEARGKKIFFFPLVAFSSFCFFAWADCESKDVCKQIQEEIISRVGYVNDDERGGLLGSFYSVSNIAYDCDMRFYEIKRQIASTTNDLSSVLNRETNLTAQSIYQLQTNIYSLQEVYNNVDMTHNGLSYIYFSVEQGVSDAETIKDLAMQLPCDNCCSNSVAFTNCVIVCITNDVDILDIVCRTNCVFVPGGSGTGQDGGTNGCCCCDFDWLKVDLSKIEQMLYTISQHLEYMRQFLTSIESYCTHMHGWMLYYEENGGRDLYQDWNFAFVNPMPFLPPDVVVATNRLPYFTYKMGETQYNRLTGNFFDDVVRMLDVQYKQDNWRNAILANISSNLATRVNVDRIASSNEQSISDMETDLFSLTNGEHQLALSYTNDFQFLTDYPVLDFWHGPFTGTAPSFIEFEVPMFFLGGAGENAKHFTEIVRLDMDSSFYSIMNAVRTLTSCVIWVLAFYLLLYIIRLILRITILVLSGINKIKDYWNG